MTTADPSRSWTSAWPDALAFAAGLAVAWLSGWTAADLVWSLWLSSLVVGYATIVWKIVRPAVTIGRGAWHDRALVRQAMQERRAVAGLIVLGFAGLVAGLFMLAFFTLHFGMFHFVHSQFLATFFPIGETAAAGSAGLETYLEVARRYWTFLPAAFLAERAAFAVSSDPVSRDRSVTAEAIAARKAENARRRGQGMMAPYRNVVRMHLLIFFFAFASFATLDNFAVYAVVYAVYFFPWRLVRGVRATAATATTSPAS
jgi:hypothetical protein